MNKRSQVQYTWVRTKTHVLVVGTHSLENCTHENKWCQLTAGVWLFWFMGLSRAKIVYYEVWLAHCIQLENNIKLHGWKTEEINRWKTMLSGKETDYIGSLWFYSVLEVYLLWWGSQLGRKLSIPFAFSAGKRISWK